MNKHTFTAGSEDSGMRLDRWVRQRLSLTGLSRIFRLIRTGDVRVNGKKKTNDYRITDGDIIDVRIAEAELDASKKTGEPVPSNLVNTEFFKRNFKLLFEDENLLVCDKPCGLVVHSGTGHINHDSLIDLATAYLSQKATSRADNSDPSIAPLLVHRLDRDTSGVILIAKNRRILRCLHEDFRQSKMHKTYIAFCHGKPEKNSGVIELDMVKDFDTRDGAKMRVGEGGQHSRSVYRVMASRAGVSRVEIGIETGRMHQIRVHMAYLQCPVIGDVRYGDSERDKAVFSKCSPHLRRLYLHARRISFFYPDVKKQVTFESEEPPQLRALWESLSSG